MPTGRPCVSQPAPTPTTPATPAKASSPRRPFYRRRWFLWPVITVTVLAIAVLLAFNLSPTPGALLWDVGAGAGSVAVEWSRTHPSCRAVAVERDPERAERIDRNALTLGVPDLRVVTGRAPEALAGLDAPDAVFVGGGATVDGVLDACWAALRPGGRLVVHGVTLETEQLLVAWRARVGGELVRLLVETAAPLGTFTSWTPARAVTQLSVVKGSVVEEAQA